MAQQYPESLDVQQNDQSSLFDQAEFDPYTQTDMPNGVPKIISSTKEKTMVDGDIVNTQTDAIKLPNNEIETKKTITNVSKGLITNVQKSKGGQKVIVTKTDQKTNKIVSQTVLLIYLKFLGTCGR